MGELANQFDIIVIGAGPGGYVGAVRAAQLGFKTACVEMRDTLGGTCLNVGCIPSKALLESSHHFHQVNHSMDEHGINVGHVSLDLAKMIKRKDEVVTSITGGVDYLFKKNKITWLKGFGSVQSPNTVSVKNKEGDVTTYQAKYIIVATGSVPIQIPPVPFDHSYIVDSTDALNFKEIPKKLLVVGGGVIGLELGSVWQRLGAHVEIIEAQDKILGGTDVGVSKDMLKLLKKQGMTFHLKTMLEKAEIKDNQVILHCRQGDKIVEFEADKVLVAVGRRPLTENLGLKEVGVTLDERGFVSVDHNYQTNVKGVYAIGDAIPGPMLAHKAEEEGIAVVEKIAGQAGHVNYGAVANVVYTWPEIASVGWTEEECKNQGLSYNTGKFYFKANGRAKAMSSTDGYVKIIADKKTDKVLGVHIIGPMASEMISEAAIAYEYGASSEDIARSVHAHPTLAEVMKEAALDVDKRAIHS